MAAIQMILHYSSNTQPSKIQTTNAAVETEEMNRKWIENKRVKEKKSIKIEGILRGLKKK